MLRGLIPLFLLATPAPASACFSCCYTYDLAEPGVWGLMEPLAYQYVLGRVSKVEPGKTPEGYSAVKVTIEVLKDYRFPQGAATVQALASDSHCLPRVKVGMLGKFGIDDRGGTPRLVLANYSF